MGRLEDEVRELILEQHRSLAAFARETGISKNTLYSALDNGFAGSTLATIKPIVESLGLDISEFAKGNVVALDDGSRSVPVPIYGDIAAGKPIDQNRVKDYFPLPYDLYKAHPNAFMLRVRGSSMNRVLPDGHYALVDPESTVDSSSDLYAVSIGQEKATIKHVRMLSNGIELFPDSDDPTHHPMVFDYADPELPEVRLIGRVVWHCPPTGQRDLEGE